LCDTGRRKLLEADEYFHLLADFRGIRVGHDGADVRNEPNQAFRLERLQGLPQGRARDAKFLAQLRLRQTLTRFPAVLDDIQPQVRQDLIVHRRVANDRTAPKC
jgi:hypothetical protein